MPKESKKRLDENEINRLKAIVGMEKVNQAEEDEVEKLRKFVEADDASPKLKNTASRKGREETSSEEHGIPAERKEQEGKKKIEKSGSTVVEETDLFVKIDNHKEIASSLLEARKEIKSIASTVELLAKAESLKEEGIRRMEKHVEKMEQLWKNVVNNLAETNRIYPEYLEGVGGAENKELMDLKAELDKLKHILERMK